MQPLRREEDRHEAGLAHSARRLGPRAASVLVAHDLHQQSSEGLQVGLDARARQAIEEGNAIEFGEVCKRDENLVGGAFQLKRYHIAANRFPIVVVICADCFENESVYRVHLLDRRNEGLAHRVLSVRVHRGGQ
jgi:hypothetical protein